MKRGKFIAGNWKMNKGAAESLAFLVKLISLLEKVKEIESRVPDPVNVALFPQAINLLSMGEYLRNSKINIKLGIQNIHWQLSGAFTGENSIKSAVEAGSSFALVGHSERRHLFQEGNDIISKKFTSCLENGLKPVLCVGETEHQKNQGSTEKVIEDQVRSVFSTETMALLDIGRVYIAYEPVWAIGTGVTPTPEQAQDMHAFIRSLIPESRRDTTRILYGGSLSAENALEFFRQPDIDGGLVGGASLKPAVFREIVLAAVQARS